MLNLVLFLLIADEVFHSFSWLDQKYIFHTVQAFYLERDTC